MEVWFVLALVTLTLGSCIAFLFDNSCPAPVPCRCEHTDINCSRIGLLGVPVFKNITGKISQNWTVNLNDNLISSIARDAFLSLREYSVNNNLYLYLPGNNLTDGSIDVNAFRGIEHLVHTLDLSDNKLESVPSAIASLVHLKELKIVDNPLKNVDPYIFTSIGHSLLSLTISPTYVPAFPSAFHYLVALENLTIQNYALDIPADGFIGFQITLKHLVMTIVKFQFIPVPVCGLYNLETLEISFDENLDGVNLVHCTVPMRSVKKLTFRVTSMRVFPDLSKIFLNLEELYIALSNLKFIDDTVIPPNSNLTILSITDSKLEEIPGAVNEFPRLEKCDLSKNLIHTVERHSIADLPYLRSLTLDDNPIVFVSEFAFWNVSVLTHLSMQRTMLATIPQAVESMPSLKQLELQNNPILCNCDHPWMKNWHYLPVTINGTCNLSTEPIKQFLINVTPNCP